MIEREILLQQGESLKSNAKFDATAVDFFP